MVKVSTVAAPLDSVTKKALHSALVRWYRKHGKQFLWRETRDPYVILVSEIMLQQTQSQRVIEKLPVFLKRFPTLKALATARREDVIRAWKGMGYNRRAVSLHAFAKEVVRTRKNVPEDIGELVHLPGIGKYTASAIACFAFGRRVPVVDVNIRRVLSRLVLKRETLDSFYSDREIWEIAEQLLPRKHWYEWNQALMDMGSTYCRGRNVDCKNCPLRQQCASSAVFQHAKQNNEPRKKTNREPMYLGIPRRIWRGRLVECLRTKQKITIHQAAVELKLPVDANTKEWLKELFGALMRDGLARRVNTGYTLA